ncbi:SDR family oxidoreductase [Caballeronia sp. GAWG2-1]|uniref:SDR family NAD(P)-dependent oxidoreductase n=1 Tax=Caballeronia sp. GAWG2-1 TaxID=2921744 RepID=UPI002028656B|nr:SDR family oxidoreductase [Caballeronia sp. GAWG2-1]
MNQQRNQTDSWMGLDGRVCVVTGAGSGIGAGTARELAALGASVALIDRDLETASAVAAAIRDSGGRAEAFKADVKSADDISTAAARIGDAIGPCHVLVNNAASVGYGGALLDGDMAAWSHTLDVNVTGALLCTRIFGRQMIEAGHGGSIVNVASICGRAPLPSGGAYSVSKAALVMLTRVLALELAEHGIRCNAVSPGLVHTTATEAAYSDSTVAQARRQIVPVGRIAEPVDLASVIAFLASDRSGYINGEDILTDGGFSHTLMTHVPQPAKPMRPR